MPQVAADAFIGVSPTLAIFPGAAIALAVFGANLLVGALRDVLDPGCGKPDSRVCSACCQRVMRLGF